MITEIPTSEEFERAALNLLYLGWQLALEIVRDADWLEEFGYDLTPPEQETASKHYWQRSQPALGNALALIQQSVELALKGKIAAVTPYLLISGDPSKWPASDANDIPFSAFRTIDAADLLRVLDSVRTPRTDEEFREFWNKLRQERNSVMHSVSGLTFEVGTLVRYVLLVNEHLMPSGRWLYHCLTAEKQSPLSPVVGDLGDINVVMGQAELALKVLAPADAKRFFGFKKQRSYLCPDCYGNADKDMTVDWPKLAQFTERGPAATCLRCFVCETVTEVQRIKCVHDDCKGNVIADGMCLTCCCSQKLY